MATRRTNIVITSLGGAATVFAATALAAATPVTPPPGAVVRTAHPHFAWTLPTNERSKAIFIADKPDVTSEGRLYNENWVGGADIAADVRQWSPSRPLYAGRYWWNVLSTDRITLVRSYSPPSEFTIPVALRLYRVTARRFSVPRRRLWVDVVASANVERPLVRVRLLHGRTVVWNAAKKAYGNIIPGAIDFFWYPGRRVKRGAPLKLVASVSSNGVVRTRSVLVHAP